MHSTIFNFLVTKTFISLQPQCFGASVSKSDFIFKHLITCCRKRRYNVNNPLHKSLVLVTLEPASKKAKQSPSKQKALAAAMDDEDESDDEDWLSGPVCKRNFEYSD